MNMIKPAIVNSLERSVNSTMFEGCSFDFGNGQKKGFDNGDVALEADRYLGIIFENQLVREYSIMSEYDFSNIRAKFKCEFDPRKSGPSEESINKNQFKECS